MAIISNGTKNSIQASQRPTGYASPTVITFTDFEYTKNIDLTMLKTDVALSTGALTMQNIIEHPTVGVDTQVFDSITSDFRSSKDVKYFVDLRTITSTDTLSGGDDSWLTNAPTSYNVKVIVYIKSI
tara:strand:- start:71 stop:451 length:381 start_codon:yes stop_codon:yes gene_type:complete